MKILSTLFICSLPEFLCILQTIYSCFGRSQWGHSALPYQPWDPAAPCEGGRRMQANAARRGGSGVTRWTRTWSSKWGYWLHTGRHVWGRVSGTRHGCCCSWITVWRKAVSGPSRITEPTPVSCTSGLCLYVWITPSIWLQIKQLSGFTYTARLSVYFPVPVSNTSKFSLSTQSSTNITCTPELFLSL